MLLFWKKKLHSNILYYILGFKDLLKFLLSVILEYYFKVFFVLFWSFIFVWVFVGYRQTPEVNRVKQLFFLVYFSYQCNLRVSLLVLCFRFYFFFSVLIFPVLLFFGWKIIWWKLVTKLWWCMELYFSLYVFFLYLECLPIF